MSVKKDKLRKEYKKEKDPAGLFGLKYHQHFGDMGVFDIMAHGAISLATCGFVVTSDTSETVKHQNGMPYFGSRSSVQVNHLTPKMLKQLGKMLRDAADEMEFLMEEGILPKIESPFEREDICV